jgi:Small metal-binding protein
MNIKTIAITTAFLLSGAFAFAESVHLPQAVEHTKAAITHGEAGHASVLVEHASTALTHAKASEKAEANPHTEEGITHLKAAIDVGKKGDATAGGTTHAKEALKHLELASQPKK